MRLKLIGCKVLMRELYALCAESEHVVDIEWMEAALHETPKELRRAIQEKIDAVEGNEREAYDAILLGFGLCSMGIVGLRTAKYPLIVPRAHDCITMLLGSRARYDALFREHSGGVYWYSPGWIEQFKSPGRGYGDQDKYMAYVEKYGEDNARYLIATERGWTQSYSCATLIRWPMFAGRDFYERATREAAEASGLAYVEEPGDDALLKKLVGGEWDGEFMILRPGEELAYSGDERILCARGEKGKA